jgi:hypothetical protein
MCALSSAGVELTHGFANAAFLLDHAAAVGVQFSNVRGSLGKMVTEAPRWGTIPYSSKARTSGP